MSIHIPLNQEAQARLAAEQRNITISSFIIGFLVVVMICLILGFMLMTSLTKEIPVIVSYQPNVMEETKEMEKKMQSSVKQKPSSPSSSMAKVIAANTAAEVSIPVPDEVSDVQSLEFGNGEDFGSGWGDGSGDGIGGGGASFFNQKVSAQRITYVIDYSMSMKGERDALMRKELTKSVDGLSRSVQFQMIYFSGPAWVAGSELPGFNYQKEVATVKGKGGNKYEWTGKGLHDWTPKGKKQPVEWLDADLFQLKDAREIIAETPLSGGTDWENPLLMAFDMDPPPQIVFFMTDGAVGERDMMKLTDDLASKAKKKGIIVNTIAMMEPKANEAMANLANKTGGEFTIIDKNGKASPGNKAKKAKKVKKGKK